MRKYIKPVAEVVEISFGGNIATLTPGKNVFSSGDVGSSTDAGISLFSDGLNGLTSSNTPSSISISEEENQ